MRGACGSLRLCAQPGDARAVPWCAQPGERPRHARDGRVESPIDGPAPRERDARPRDVAPDEARGQRLLRASAMARAAFVCADRPHTLQQPLCGSRLSRLAWAGGVGRRRVAPSKVLWRSPVSPNARRACPRGRGGSLHARIRRQPSMATGRAEGRASLAPWLLVPAWGPPECRAAPGLRSLRLATGDRGIDTNLVPRVPVEGPPVRD